MDEDRADLRRWIISAAIVALLHGGVVMAVLKWHKATPAEPFVMDLAPWAGAPWPAAAAPQAAASQQGGSQQPAAGTERSAASEPPAASGEPAQSAARERTDSGGLAEAPQGKGLEARTANHGGGLSQGAPSIGHENGHGSGVAAGVMPVSPMPPTNSAMPSGSAPAAGSPVPGVPAPSGPAATATNPFDNSPIDTSITVQPWLHGRKGVAAIDQKGGLSGIGQKGHVMFRPFNHAGEPPQPGTLNLPGASILPGATATRVQGAHVQDRARAAATRQVNAVGTAATGMSARGGANAGGTVTTNAIGIAAPGVGGKGGGNAGANVATNAVGITVQLPRGAAATKSIDGRGANTPNIPAMNSGERNTGSVALAGPALSNASAINGRTMIHAGAATGVIGGPARRAASGVINGTDFHAKVP